MDKNIFKYYLKQAYLEGKLTEKDLKQQAICHQIFPPTEYKFAFLSEQIRDDFNAGLKQITQDGSLVAICPSRWHQSQHRFEVLRLHLVPLYGSMCSCRTCRLPGEYQPWVLPSV